jgi:hypothetical protein
VLKLKFQDSRPVAGCHPFERGGLFWLTIWYSIFASGTTVKLLDETDDSVWSMRARA